MGRTVQKTPAQTPYMDLFPEWLTCGPRQSCQIPQQTCARYMAKKEVRELRRPCLIRSTHFGHLRPTRFPKF